MHLATIRLPFPDARYTWLRRFGWVGRPVITERIRPAGPEVSTDPRPGGTETGRDACPLRAPRPVGSPSPV
ncbi:hypothetical protein BDK92_2850 [Micromonospora pisi]|uniref:Uncharacterized protein n=1 Tax=Micromonospora pisi TaxID=589240 RepID=A0A495JJM6_9ACTN|nr:hypothetical protein BDK92_2850 [Micromonospora pisi]